MGARPGPRTEPAAGGRSRAPERQSSRIASCGGMLFSMLGRRSWPSLSFFGALGLVACTGGAFSVGEGEGGSSGAGGSGGSATSGVASTAASGGQGGGAVVSASSAESSTVTSSSATSGSGGAGGRSDPCGSATAMASFPAESEPNDDFASATPLPDAASGFMAALCPQGDVDNYSVPATDGALLRVKVTDGAGGCPPNATPFIRVYDPSLVVIAEVSGPGCVFADPLGSPVLGNLAAGTYIVQIFNAGSALVDVYQVSLAATPPSCGDAVVQTGEECDDGNLNDGDGCSASCLDEP